MKPKQVGEKLEDVVKVIFIVLLILAVIVCPIMFFHGILKDTKTETDEKQILVELYTGYNFHIVYDAETGVEYYRAEEVMVPLYNPDGTLKVYRKGDYIDRRN